MTTPLLPAMATACKGAGKLIAAFMDTLPPDELAKLQQYLKDGCHLGIKIDFAQTGLYALLFAEGADTVYPIKSCTVPHEFLQPGAAH